MHVVLVEPQIPQNCGNIVRTCSVTGAFLCLVRPLGFSLSSRHFKRAGLDYGTDLRMEVFDSFDDYLHEIAPPQCIFFSSKAQIYFHDVAYSASCGLVFGSEDRGLPLNLQEKEPRVRIPMKEGKRCLNLSCSVAVALYEALRKKF